MGNLFRYAAFVLFISFRICSGLEPDHHWPLDSIESQSLILHGSAETGTGIDEGSSLVLDGSSLVEIPDSASLTHSEAGFSLAIWVNPYDAKKACSR